MTIYTKSDIPKISEKFNKNINRLINIIESSNKLTDIELKTLKTAISLGMNETPLLLLQKSGEYIFKYRDYIINNKFEDLINKDIEIYKTELNNNKKYINTTITDNKLKEMIEILKLQWKNYNKEEKKYIYKIFTNLLSEYSKYKTIN